MELTIASPSERYLERCPVIDHDDPSIKDLVRSRGWAELDEVERTRQAYHFVRDEVSHAWDVQSETVTCAASEVLRNRVGICYAKSHLLAALLRRMGIPCGLCYQRLVLLDDPEDGYALHSLNAAYLSSVGKWVRFDARGNKPGVNAELDLEGEQLAFPVRPELGEVDERVVFAAPRPSTIRALRSGGTMSEIYRHGLPSELDKQFVNASRCGWHGMVDPRTGDGQMPSLRNAVSSRAEARGEGSLPQVETPAQTQPRLPSSGDAGTLFERL